MASYVPSSWSVEMTICEMLGWSILNWLRMYVRTCPLAWVGQGGAGQGISSHAGGEGLSCLFDLDILCRHVLW